MEAAAPGGPRDQAGREGGRGVPERKTPLALVAAAALGAAGALLVNHFLPPVLERLNDPEPLLVAAQYDPILYESCGWSALVPAAAVAEGAPQRPSRRRCLPGFSSTKVRQWVSPRSSCGWRVAGPTSLRSSTCASEAKEVTELETGAILNIPCDGELGVVNLGFRLTGPDVAYEINENGDWGPPYFSRNTITLAKDEILPISARVDAGQGLPLTATTDRFVWSLDVSVAEDGNESVVSLPETFVTAAAVDFALNEWTLLALDGPLRWWSRDELDAFAAQ